MNTADKTQASCFQKQDYGYNRLPVLTFCNGFSKFEPLDETLNVMSLVHVCILTL
jgi:hypothetical protein